MSALSVYGIIAAAVTGGWLYMYMAITVLEAELATAQSSIIVESVNNVTLRATIEDNNKVISIRNEELASSKLLVEEWRSKPATVKYRVIYKELPASIDLKKDDCETTKSVISAIRNIDFAEL